MQSTTHPDLAPVPRRPPEVKPSTPKPASKLRTAESGQARAFASLVAEVAGLRMAHRAALRLLMDTSACFSQRDLAGRLGYAETEFQKRKPTRLIALGLIEESQQGRGKVYRDNVEATLRGKFPDLDEGWMVRQLVEALG